MRSMMLIALFITGCACCKKQEWQPVPPNGTIFYPPPPPLPNRVIETTPPPELPPQPTTGKVKVTEVVPVHIFPPLPIEPEPIELPPWEEPKIVFPKNGQPFWKSKINTNFKMIVLENPPYNGPPNIGWEIYWQW